MLVRFCTYSFRKRKQVFSKILNTLFYIEYITLSATVSLQCQSIMTVHRVV